MSIFIWFILIGLAAGWLAGQFLKGGTLGITGDIVVGVIGALIGGILFQALGVSTGGGISGELTAATLGSIVLLLFIRQLRQTS